MPKRILDTNVLITHFRRLGPLKEKSPAEAADWGRKLIDDKGTKAIVLPVVVEILAGVRDSHELALTEAYLGTFLVIDEKKGTPPDCWEEAKRIAKRIPRYPSELPRSKGKRARQQNLKAASRDFGDCLIIAIANKMGFEVLTDDKGLIRQSGRTRKS